jgi:molybdopterin-guanine dinucleotide biosynthesis protein A
MSPTQPNPPIDIKPLILLGGLSSRFVNPTQNKALLPIPQAPSPSSSPPSSPPTALPLYQHILTLLQSGLPSSYSSLFSSLLASLPASTDPLSLPPLLAQSSSPTPIQFISDPTDGSIHGGPPHGLSSVQGPALGLLTAHAHHPSSHLLVIAVDFPLLQAETLTRLIDNHLSNLLSSERPGDEPTRPTISAYLHPSDSFPEPLLSIWSPAALSLLKTNAVERGRTGPCSTLKQIWKEEEEEEEGAASAAGEEEEEGKRKFGGEKWGVRVGEEEQWWLAGCNDWAEWEVCRSLMMGHGTEADEREEEEEEEEEEQRKKVEEARRAWREPAKAKKKKKEKREDKKEEPVLI